MNKFLVVTTSVFSVMAVRGMALQADEEFEKPKQAEASCTGIK